MTPLILENIARIRDFDQLETIEVNIRRGDALSPDVDRALQKQYAELSRALIATKTGLDLEELTPVEERIVEAISKYVVLQRRKGKKANYTFRMLSNRGLIESAEVSVSRAQPTMGFEALDEAELKSLSFEQIILDYPEDFSPRARWFARRTLGLPNESERPPAAATLVTQVRCEELLQWYKERVLAGDGHLSGLTNEDAGRVLGLTDLTKSGRALGNITSRIDFACFACGLPPLGLTADKHFANAWNTEGRAWDYPIEKMKQAAKTKRWTIHELDRVLAKTTELPGTASIPWKRELSTNERAVQDWAFSLQAYEVFHQAPPSRSEMLKQEVARVAELERQALSQPPELKKKTSFAIERGPIGKALKKATGYKCQLCEALGLPPHSFIMRNDIPYTEAHHVVPVSELQVGSLAASNILILCANHHRQIHYGNVSVSIGTNDFEILIDGQPLMIRRHSFV